MNIFDKSFAPSEATIALAPNLEVPDPRVDHAVGRRHRSAWLRAPVLISIAVIVFWVLVWVGLLVGIVLYFRYARLLTPLLR